ncbi:MAG: AbrB/MazE/SpoVT family DNA-binding domain-containing protein [Clostridiales bacterium]|nr:AbrB/MazE/SpoVT family DNA-binding domain-containing protein [Clostridiales bacterium]
MLLEGTKRTGAMSRRARREKRNISSKGQVTIPRVFIDELGFEGEVEFIKRGNELVLRPVRAEMDFSQEILNDLVAQGLSGQELLAEFAAIKNNIRPAAEQMLEDAKSFAKRRKKTGDKETEEIFGVLD